MLNAGFSTKIGLLLLSFTEVGGNVTSLVCREQIPVFQDYRLNRHDKIEHAEKYKNLTNTERVRTLNIRTKLQKQKGFLFIFFDQASQIQGCNQQCQLDSLSLLITCAKTAVLQWTVTHSQATDS